jgi:hypothetical protein
MAWRINALHASAFTQLGMNWGLCIGSLIIVLPTVWTVSNHTTVEAEAGYEGEKDLPPPKTVEDVEA